MHTRWIKTSVAWLLAWQMAGAAAPAAAQPPAPAQAQWATSWMAAPEPTWGPDYVLPLGMPETLRDVTLRQSLRLAVGGDRLRLVLSNVHGAQPLRLGRVQVAAEAGGRFLPVKFGGTDGTVIAAGAQALSDPIDLPVPDGARLRVDIDVPAATRPAGFDWVGRERAVLVPGEAVG